MIQLSQQQERPRDCSVSIIYCEREVPLETLVMPCFLLTEDPQPDGWMDGWMKHVLYQRYN